MLQFIRKAASDFRSLFRPSPGDDSPAHPGKDINLGLLTAGAFFVVFLGWAAFAPLDAGAYAPGDVVVSGSRQAVQHRDGGIVSALHIHEGDLVRKGQVLLEISAGESSAVERALTAQVLALKAQKARLIAERDSAHDLSLPPEFTAFSPKDQALAGDVVRLQRDQLLARRASMAARQRVLRQKIEQLREQIAGFERQLSANSRQQELIEDELVGVKTLSEKGYAPMSRVRAIERAAADLEGRAGALRADTARAEAAIAQTQMEIIALERAAAEEVMELLRQTEAQLADVEPKLRAAREQLARAQVRAPASGRIVGLSVFTVGGVVQPGQMLMEVVPTKAELILRARVSPDHADDIRVGQQAEVRFSAFHERDLPIVLGEIINLSADSFADEKTGQRYFVIDVTVPPAEIAKIARVRGRAIDLQPGLPVEVVVPLARRTALQYLLEPLEQSVWRSFREP